MEKQWKAQNMKIISNIYLNVELDSTDDWIRMTEETQNEGLDEVQQSTI